MHDDLVARDFDVDQLDALWLTDITEHPTGLPQVRLTSSVSCRSREGCRYAAQVPA